METSIHDIHYYIITYFNSHNLQFYNKNENQKKKKKHPTILKGYPAAPQLRLNQMVIDSNNTITTRCFLSSLLRNKRQEGDGHGLNIDKIRSRNKKKKEKKIESERGGK